MPIGSQHWWRGRFRSMATLLLWLCAAVLLAPGQSVAGSGGDTGGSVSQDAIGEALERARSRSDLQTSLPEPEVPERREEPDRPDLDWDLDLAWVVDAAPYILGALLILLLILNRDRIAAWLALQRYRGSSYDVPPTAETTEAVPMPDLGQLLEDADRLADSGRHASACGMLLRLALPELAGCMGLRWQSSITAREAQRHLPLPVSERADLRRLVQTAERGRFAGVSLTLDDYEAARALALSLLENAYQAAHRRAQEQTAQEREAETTEPPASGAAHGTA